MDGPYSLRFVTDEHGLGVIDNRQYPLDTTVQT